ncbi:MAG: hypothetical protein U1E90_07190 [Burkholderiaceae bacterium]
MFAFVADFWGRRLRSDVPIQVLATFAPLDCDSTSGVLRAAGAYNVFADFPNGKPGTWYPGALANKLTGVKLEPDPNPFRQRRHRVVLQRRHRQAGLSRRPELLPRGRRQGSAEPD